ncbi:acetoacetate decarboxylase family protein [Amycolatopsis sp. PS_44_ISF1]|uniref:acetoacetate decarboxylase family protein n=1 Tax=Amycolatopsis sp. PS_44_ISF1 TaxID=2974917 RepID=UPI0028DD7E14|nr:acetoacetate decarboxylase family protein [Amycolatopsis sp. PS_44_ISF1]MDT8913913.1 acetoacetate decarboxylase family protein [Amycolatopsis sp. PS_44_ISF1]
MTAYPPEPWRLTGEAHLSAWRLPAAQLPALPEGVEPLIVAGRALVVTAWFHYRPPGQLSYHELLAAVAVRAPRPTASITGIWVDSEVSLAGGRALWGTPKDLATFGFRPGRTFTATAATEHDWIATAAFSRRAGLPVAVPAGFRIVQTLGGRLERSRVAVRAKPAAAAAGWSVNPRGPLGYLAGHRPVVSGSLMGFDLTFGG